MSFFLMGPTAEGQSPFSWSEFLMPFILVFFIMWLFLIRPQRKEQKKREEMLSSMRKGDTVVTNGGIVGKVVKLKEDRIEIKVDESHDIKMTFLRSAVLNVIAKDEKEPEETKK